MHLHDILNEQLQNAQNLFHCPLRILETGTIRGETDNYATDDGWSTLCFVDWVKEHGGWVESIDLDIDTAVRVLQQKRGLFTDILDSPTRSRVAHWQKRFDPEHEWNVGLNRAHSIDYLVGALADAYPGVDGPDGTHLAYLDSDNDPTLILCEYLLVTRLMPSGGIVLVDDVNLAAGSESLKGHAVVPWLERHNQPFTIVQRQGQGYRTGVLITRVP